MTPSRLFPVLALALAMTTATPGLLAAGKDTAKSKEPFYESKTKWFTLRLVPRTAEQMAGFYEGRGFSREAIDHIRSRCFVTAMLRNTSTTVVWLELANWEFRNKQGPVARVGRPVWKREWTEQGLPAAHQATFSWTLMPESRDLQAEEPVGGNITLPRVDGPITLRASFYLGADRSGGKHEVTIRGDLCR